AELARPPQPARFPVLEVRRDVAGLATEPAPAALRRKRADRPDAGDAARERLTHCGAAGDSERAHAADPGHDHPTPRGAPGLSGWHPGSAAPRRGGTGG